MNRNPSLHITQTQLLVVLKELKVIGALQTANLPKLATALLTKARSKSNTTRALLPTNQKTQQRITKFQSSTTEDTGLFVETLTLKRRQFKHRGINLIKPGTNEWLQAKEVTKLATEFCIEFGLNLKEGYKEYLQIGLPKIKNYSLSKFNYLHPAIVKEYEATLEIKSDKTPALTNIAYLTYTQLVSEKIGTCFDYKTLPEKYCCFIHAKVEAQQNRVDIPTYIKAQFHGMEYRSGIPDPYQLTGIKAIERLHKYCFENHIKITNQDVKVNFNKIKKNGKTKNHS